MTDYGVRLNIVTHRTHTTAEAKDLYRKWTYCILNAAVKYNRQKAKGFTIKSMNNIIRQYVLTLAVCCSGLKNIFLSRIKQ